MSMQLFGKRIMTHREILIDKLKQGSTFKIVFLGDSITSAEWVHPNYREIIEYVLKQELENDLEDWKLPSWGIRVSILGLMVPLREIG